jgi:hypothetical protein
VRISSIERHEARDRRRLTFVLGGLMVATRSGDLQLGLILATALAVLMLPTAAEACTPEGQQACTGDAFRLCSAEIPNVDRVRACLHRNKAQLNFATTPLASGSVQYGADLNMSPFAAPARLECVARSASRRWQRCSWHRRPEFLLTHSPINHS